jgi:hypothetical protein
VRYAALRGIEARDDARRRGKKVAGKGLDCSALY